MTYLVYMNYMLLVYMCTCMQIIPSALIGILILLGNVALAVHIFLKDNRRDKG